MTIEPKDQRVPVMMTASELKAVDDWSFAQRIRSRGEAIRQLIELGLRAVAKPKAKPDRPDKPSAPTPDQEEPPPGATPDPDSPLSRPPRVVGGPKKPGRSPKGAA